MTFRQKYFSSNLWQQRAAIMSLYHQIRQIESERWTLQKTADYFNCSIGLVSENINITSRIEELKDCLTRNEALLRIGRKLK